MSMRPFLLATANVFVFAAFASVAHADGATLNNPAAFNDIPSLIGAFFGLVVRVGLPFVTLGFVYAGFQYELAQGNEAKIKQAHGAFLYSVIGAVLILGCATIEALLAGTVKALYS